MLSPKILKQIEIFLDSRTAKLNVEPLVKEAVRYAIFPAGKRFRPRLCLSLCADLGGLVDSAIGYACALEILHCASLVHDDLPALDNDDMRRGRATCHVKFGEATALIAADLMIGLAFEFISQPRDDRTPFLGDLVAQISLAWTRLCSGQAFDLLECNNRKQLIETHMQKTGALIAAATAGAAIISGHKVTSQNFQQFYQLGETLGLLFQVVDDLVDQFGDDLERGRSGSSDRRNNRSRICVLGGKDAALDLVAELWGKVNKELEIKELKNGATSRLLQTTFANIPGFAGALK